MRSGIALHLQRVQWSKGTASMSSVYSCATSALCPHDTLTRYETVAWYSRCVCSYLSSRVQCGWFVVDLMPPSSADTGDINAREASMLGAPLR
jgi:hypothetical protein